MSWTDAMEIVVARTRVERYRWLCSDANPDIDSREAYRALMARKAAGQPEPQPTLLVTVAQPDAIADPWLPLIRACEDHNPGCCSHPAAFCSRFTKDVSREQCIECLTADENGPRKG